MCGIFGYIGQTAKINTLLTGLKNLEYRGYDSAGIAYIKDNNIILHKKSGKVEKLCESVDKSTNFSVGVAHTRWATHGFPSEINAHPHLSFNKNFCVVHNGIIENYTELKNKYLQNISLVSDTDTEVIAHLFEKLYKSGVETTLKKVCSLLKGSFALAVITSFEPNKLYLAKKSSPLLFGINKNGYYFSSDVNTLGEFCDKYFKLEDNEFVVLEKNKFVILNYNSIIQKEPYTFCNNIKKKKNVVCYMNEEILETSTAIKNTTLHFQEQFSKIPRDYFNNIDKIILIACGTAYHSCLIGKKYLEYYYKIPILTEIASEFIYSSPNITSKTLCIFVSQSGETADTLLALRLAKKLEAKTLAITNNATSTITFESEYSIFMQAGWEKAVASTKAYSTQVAVFYLLSCALDSNLELAKNNLMLLANNIDIFKYDNWIKNTCDIITNYKKVIFIGRQLSYFTAMEASLKLKEITYINSIACASGELKHGTLALVDSETLVIAIFCEDNLTDKNLNTLKEIQARNGNVIILSNSFEITSINEQNNLLLPNFQADLLPIIAILPLQTLACEISKKLGNNPDMPKNLSKSVTVE